LKWTDIDPNTTKSEDNDEIVEETKHEEPKHVETKHVETKHVETKHVETKQEEPKKVETKQENQRPPLVRGVSTGLQERMKAFQPGATSTTEEKKEEVDNTEDKKISLKDRMKQYQESAKNSANFKKPTDSPKPTEETKTEEPKKEEPKTEEPKKEEPKKEEPKKEETKKEEPKKEEPKKDEPKKEETKTSPVVEEKKPEETPSPRARPVSMIVRPSSVTSMPTQTPTPTASTTESKPKVSFATKGPLSVIPLIAQNDPSVTAFGPLNGVIVSPQKLLELAKALESNTHVTRVDISGTSSTNLVGVAFSQLLTINNTIQVLDLSHNKIDADTYETLSKALENNTGLIELNLFGNKEPGSKALQFFIESFRKNITLRDIKWRLNSRQSFSINKSLTRNKEIERRKKTRIEMD